MTANYRWGKLRLYTHGDNDNLRAYWWNNMEMHVVSFKLNDDNSLHMYGNDKLIPAQMWHDIAAQSDKIITYLMLKRK
jgi:hypothetical protein